MKAQRCLHRCVGLFPAQYRATRGDELHDALTSAAPGGWALVREALSLGLAAFTAWRRFLATPAGLRNTMFFGAMSWFGVVIALGPVGRVQAFDRGGLYGFYDAGARGQSVLAAGFLLVSFVVLFRSRLLAAVAGAIAVVAAAMSIRAGQWQLPSSLPYEASWVGLPLVAALWLRGDRRVRWPVAVSAVPALLLVLGPFGHAERGPGYGYHLTRLNDPLLQARPACSSTIVGDAATVCAGLDRSQAQSILSGHWLELVAIVVGLAVLVGPWFVPASAAVMLPAAVHLSVQAPQPATIALTAYLAGVMWIRVFGAPDLSMLRIRGSS